MNKAIPAAMGCPDIAIEKQDAYTDNLKGLDDNPDEDPIGLMGCYCKEETHILLPWTIVTHNFREFSDLNKFKDGMDNKSYCL